MGKPTSDVVVTFKRAMAAGDSKGMALAMLEAMAQDEERLRAAAAWAAQREAEFAARPLASTCVRLSCLTRLGKRLYVKSVRYADKSATNRDGWRVSAFSYTADRAEAAIFGGTSAVEVGKQLAATVRGAQTEAV